MFRPPPGYAPDLTQLCLCGFSLFLVSYSDAKMPFISECPPLRVAHAAVDQATTVSHGTRVTVECLSPYTLVGNPRPRCHNGEFIDIPKCQNSGVFDVTGRAVAFFSILFKFLASGIFICSFYGFVHFEYT